MRRVCKRFGIGVRVVVLLGLSAWSAASGAGTGGPEFGKSFVAAPVRGHVLVAVPGPALPAANTGRMPAARRLRRSSWNDRSQPGAEFVHEFSEALLGLGAQVLRLAEQLADGVEAGHDFRAGRRVGLRLVGHGDPPVPRGQLFRRRDFPAMSGWRSTVSR